MPIDNSLQQLSISPDPSKNHPSFLKWVVLASVLFVAMGLGLFWQFSHEKHQALTAERSHEIDVEFKPKKAEMERLFALAYQNVRTVTLLPSIRSLAGSNRFNENEDMVTKGRFTSEGHSTVQQIYNNLSFNTGVSEMYCVLKGFDPTKGQFPFFMYDAIVMGEKKTEENIKQEQKNNDAPEESEAAEYEEYPHHLALLESKHATFDGNEIDAIPALSSKALRTCDNAQYLSKSHGDSLNALGFLYSSPIYGRNGKMTGVISAILRINVLEARLLGLPFIPITPADSVQFKAQNLKMPLPGRFVLLNRETGLNVADRRNPELLEKAMGIGDLKDFDDGLLHQEAFKIQDQNPWSIVYAYNLDTLNNIESGLLKKFFVELLLVLLLTVGATYVWIHFLMRQSNQMRALSEQQRMLVRQKENIEIIRSNVLKLSQAATELTGFSNSMRQATTETQSRTQSVSTSSEQISAMVSALSGNTEGMSRQSSEMNEGIGKLLLTVDSSIKEIHETVHVLAELQNSTHEVEGITKMIKGITDKTNLLALNANIEASRAGEHGRGFSVVANEVKALAGQTSDAARKIDDKLNSIRESSQKVTDQMQGIETLSSQIQKLREVMENGIESQSRVTSEIAIALKEASVGSNSISGEIGEIATTAKMTREVSVNTSQAAVQLNQISEALNQLLARL